MAPKMQDAKIFRFHIGVLLVSMIIYLITAVNSKGYLHWDEHYQIIEFASLKLGGIQPSDIAWEYQAQIRSAFQPAICIFIVKLLHIFNISDPYTLACSLRLLSGFLSLLAIYLWVKSSFNLVATRFHKAYILLCHFLWFLPFLNVRFSSETWSGIFILMAISVLQYSSPNTLKRCYLVGMLLGVSFLCRFQSALIIVSFIAWLCLINKQPIKKILSILAGILSIVVIGILLDSWFYGNIVFTAWNYFNTNIINGVASLFGTSPWYQYVNTIISVTLLPIGILIICCYCLLIYRKSNLLIIWITLPFLLVHSIIPHKEDRFLVPLVNFVPIIICLGYQEFLVLVAPKVKLKASIGLIAWVIVIFLTVINAIALSIMMVKPMGNGGKLLSYYIHNKYRKKNAILISYSDSNPYNPLRHLGLNESFYDDKNIKEYSVKEMLHKKDTIVKPANYVFILKKEAVQYPDNLLIIERYKLKPKIQSIPGWIENLAPYTNQLNKNNTLILYSNN